MRAVSQFVSTILLIAMSILVFGILSTWLINYVNKTGTDVASQSENKLICSHGAINAEVNACDISNTINVTIENSGDITLGNITLQLIYTDHLEKVYLCYSNGYTFNCTKQEANLTLRPGDVVVFNSKVSGINNLQRIHVNTNCTDVKRVVESYEFSDIC